MEDEKLNTGLSNAWSGLWGTLSANPVFPRTWKVRRIDKTLLTGKFQPGYRRQGPGSSKCLSLPSALCRRRRLRGTGLADDARRGKPRTGPHCHSCLALTDRGRGGWGVRGVLHLDWSARWAVRWRPNVSEDRNADQIKSENTAQHHLITLPCEPSAPRVMQRCVQQYTGLSRVSWVSHLAVKPQTIRWNSTRNCIPD